MMSQDGFEMPLAAQHPVISDASLVVDAGGRAPVLGKASHSFCLGAVSSYFCVSALYLNAESLLPMRLIRNKSA